jgi:exodeoxyribonuclease VII small subunit
MLTTMPKKEMTYHEALAEAEKVLKQLECDELDIDEMSDAVKYALDMLRLCRQKLRATQEEIEKRMEEKSHTS